MVGNTHDDVDQLFNRVSTKLCQENAPSLQERHSIITRCLDSSINFKEQIININGCGGIKSSHESKFVKDGSSVNMSIKD